MSKATIPRERIPRYAKRLYLKEVWKDIPGCEGYYRISSEGRIRSISRNVLRYRNGKPHPFYVNGKSLRGYKTKSGHICIGLGALCKRGRKSRRGVTLWVHRLVALAFIGPCPPGLQCCHNDGNPSNNWIGNLRWDTGKSNSDDSKKHGALLIGSKHPMAKMTEQGVLNLREMRKDRGLSYGKLSRYFGISIMTVHDIVVRKIWRHL